MKLEQKAFIGKKEVCWLGISRKTKLTWDCNSDLVLA